MDLLSRLAIIKSQRVELGHQYSRVLDRCRAEEPPLAEVEPQHLVACFNFAPLDAPPGQ